MALFQLRKPRKDQPVAPAPAQTVEALRRRALHRLIGAAVLVAAGVIGFPLVFDNQPRPIPVDLPIEIVDKDKAPALVPPAPAVAAVTKEAAPPATAPAPAPSAIITESAPSTPSRAASAPAAPTPAAVETAPAAPRVAAAPAAPPAPAVPSANAEEARKARALLEGRTPPPATSASASASAPAMVGRFVVQVGAFADATKLREVRTKVERAGLKTYTQVVTTADGPRTRVRVGPFDDRSKAQQAADKIRQLDLAPSILTL